MYKMVIPYVLFVKNSKYTKKYIKYLRFLRFKKYNITNNYCQGIQIITHSLQHY